MEVLLLPHTLACLQRFIFQGPQFQNESVLSDPLDPKLYSLNLSSLYFYILGPHLISQKL